jgi:hypothetical protein
MIMNINKRFSIAHFDNCPNPSLYYEAIKNSTQQFKNEIYDIYFGKIFRYSYREQEFYDNNEKLHEVAYGNVMGVEASDEQINNLFKIQEEFGIDISLTINQLNIPVEVFYSNNNRVSGAFLDWLQDFYDRGLRSCTLANNHLMRSGLLQKRFPEMKWKNTVNQQISNAQQVLDYLYLGYNIIQLDRSLNRNMDELKRIKDVVENYKNKYQGKHIKTSMLVWECCMPFCPFAREHDDLQIYHRKINYWNSNLGASSCQRWRDGSIENIIPRFGTNCYWVTVDTFKEYTELVDVVKYSGRLTDYNSDNLSIGNWKAGWNFRGRSDVGSFSESVGSFSEIIENKLEPVYFWRGGIGDFSTPKADNIENIKKYLKDNFWMTEEGKRLEQRLKNCQNQCYKCHLCERTFGIPNIDSMIEF